MGTSSLDDRTDLTEGATEGGVTLDTAEGEYEVTLRRTDTGAVTRHGEPYLSGDQDLVCARLFAFLGEDNPIRARVRAGKDLLREPVDIEDIDAQIADLQNERDSVMRRLETAERAADNLPSVKKAISRLESELEELRNRKKEKQLELKEQFDTAMDEVIAQFAPGFDGARLDVKTTASGEVECFELVIAREGRETTVDTLSEGERELIGIVVAVAGYRTFDVTDRVPVILLDGISQLSADNLRRLVDYLDGASETLVTTAYPEAGEFGGNTVRPTEWDTISDEKVPAT